MYKIKQKRIKTDENIQKNRSLLIVAFTLRGRLVQDMKMMLFKIISKFICFPRGKKLN